MALGEVRTYIYGLPQVGRLAYINLVKHLELGGYVQTEHTTDLFKNKIKVITLCLIVDGFGIQFLHRNTIQRLLDHLNLEYKETVNWNTKSSVTCI